MADTELKLKIWRGDQIRAERLSAAILHIEGFSSIDPQCPLGGPDGLKDVLCEKSTWKYVAAAYFPTSDQPFKKIQDKLEHDLPGVAKNSADGLVFLTNQSLTPGERKTLSDIAINAGHKSIIYHLERLRAILDGPAGYGVRLEFLDIEMAREEQLSFFSKWDQSFSDRLTEHSLFIVRQISKKLDSLIGPTESLRQQVVDLTAIAQRTISLMGSSDPIRSDKAAVADLSLSVPSPQWTTASLCLLHTALLFEAPLGTQIGKLRTTQIWIAGSSSRIEDAAFVPPPAEDVPSLLAALLEEWSANYPATKAAAAATKVAAITSFHHEFLRIHPFIDGNGRLARFLLSQQAAELLEANRRISIDDRRPYFDAIQAADSGDFEPLTAVISQAIFGVELLDSSPCEMSGQKCPACGNGVLDIAAGEAGVQCGNCGLFIPGVQPNAA